MRNMLILCVMIAVVASACGSPPGAAKQGKTLAVVNGEPLTEGTLLKEVENLPPYVRPILESPEGRAQFLESVITRDLLMREALRRGIDRRPEVADRVAMARKSIVLEALLRDVAEKAPGLTDESLRKVYEANPERQKVGERVRVSHILFRDKGRALEFLEREKKGEPFEALMKEADSRNGEVAADLGEIEHGNFVKEFEKAAFAAAPGVVTGPVKTTYGYHLIKVYEKKPAGERTFEESKPQLLAEQREQAQREAFEALITELRKQATIRVLYKPEGATAGQESAGPGLSPAGPKGGEKASPAVTLPAPRTAAPSPGK